MDKSSFELVFGSTPLIKVLDFLLDNLEFDYNLTDIAKHSGIGWSTLHGFFPDLVSLGIVKQTRTIGNAKMFTLDKTNPIAKQLIQLDMKISKEQIKKELKLTESV